MSYRPVLLRPRSLAEALELLATTPEVRPLAGGASLVGMLNAGLVSPGGLVSLARIPELRGIEIAADGGLSIGAMTRHCEIADDARLGGTAAVLADAARQIGSTAVRNMGTIGGAIAHADPGLDLPPALVALAARVEIASSTARRIVAIGDFFLDWYTTVLAPGEIVVAVHLPAREPGVGLYLKHARVSGDYAIVSIAVAFTRSGEAHVAVGGCGPSPLASAEVDAMLSTGLSPAAVARAGELLVALANPVDDVRGTGEYRKTLIPRMLARALDDAVDASRTAA
jgi:carbon-monoxide dehydrogenase medium subunit